MGNEATTIAVRLTFDPLNELLNELLIVLFSCVSRVILVSRFSRVSRDQANFSIELSRLCPKMSQLRSASHHRGSHS